MLITVCVVDELNRIVTLRRIACFTIDLVGIYFLFCVRLSMIHLWLVVWNMNLIFPIILGISSSLTFTHNPSFFRGVG